MRDDGDLVTVFLPGTEVVWDTVTDDVEATRYFMHAGQVVATATGTDLADWTYLGVDHHGTTATHSVNAFSGVAHVRRMDPYGNQRGTPPQVWPGQQGFVGGVHDPTGLVHIGARSYDPLIGRFITVDPILDVTDDQQINGYTYANANPVVYSDPSGLMVCTPDGHNFCPDYDIRSQPVARPAPPPSTPSLDVLNPADYFFRYLNDGHVREVVQTSAVAPGNGVIIGRFFISDDRFYGVGVGDGRTFDDSLMAGYRVVVAWDTDLGRVSYTAAPSCLTFEHCIDPREIGDGNDFRVLEAGYGRLVIEFSARSSAPFMPAIDQVVTFRVNGAATTVSIVGDPYPDFEAIGYRTDGPIALGQSSHATPGGPVVQLSGVTSPREITWVNGREVNPVDRLVHAKRQFCRATPISPACH